MASIFNQFAILLSLSVIVGFVAVKLRQPLIFSFIIVGIIAGPNVLGWISDQSQFEVLASFGITLLLFIVGLKLDFELVKSFGTSVLLIGAGQIFLTTLLGTLLSLLVGFGLVSAFFIAFALSFSSTIIIIKILSDKHEIDSLYGRISVGILIVQDLVVIIAIIIFSSLHVNLIGSAQWVFEIGFLLIKAFAILVVIGFLTKYIFPLLLEQFAKSRELLILFAVTWAVLLAMIASVSGFTKEIGGFLAGVSLASSKYREAIASRLETMRNLMLLFFFLNLGASLQFKTLYAEIYTTILLCLFVLVVKPLIVMFLMELLRFRRRTAFLTGLTIGQVSEFSLILALLGTRLGLITKDNSSLITFVCLVTIGISTYSIVYGNAIYQWLVTKLPKRSKEAWHIEDRYDKKLPQPVDVIIYGFGRHGEHIAKILAESNLHIMGIDFDPRKVRTFHHHNIVVRYGDAEDVEFPKFLDFEGVKWVVSTLPRSDANHMLISSLKEIGYHGKIALSVYHEDEINTIKKLHPDLVIIPYEDAALSAAHRLIMQIHQEK